MLDYSVVDIYRLMYMSIYSLRNIYLLYRRLASTIIQIIFYGYLRY